MISFIISLLALVAGYFVYGKFVERWQTYTSNNKG